MYYHYVQVVDPVDFRLTLRDPPGCEPASCNVFVGIATNQGNDQYLDFYIEGQSGGWVAVGFSESQNMVSLCVCVMLVQCVSP